MCVFFRFRTHSSGVSKKDKLPVTGHPQKYDQMEIMSDIVAKEINVLKIDVPKPGGRGWKRTFSEISTQDQNLGDNWGQQMSEGARYVLKETWVKANEPHYDAKCFPAFHPHGTGSVFSEACSGGLQAHSRNRATLIDSRFRKAALWAFWKLDQQIKNELFHANNKRRQYGRPNAAGADDADGFKRSFGSAIPRNIPESSG